MSDTKSWSCKPENAWMKYIHPYLGVAGWMEDGKAISDTVPLSKRELFALVVAAHSIGSSCRVGFDLKDGIQQNDGNVHKGAKKLNFEHKLIAQMERTEVLKAIIETYEKNKNKGSEYGKNRVLIIQANKQSDHGGLIKISDLRDHIGANSPFDKVLTIGATARIDSEKYAMHIIQHYPNVKTGGSSLSQVDMDFLTGKGIARTHGVEWNN